MCIALHIVDSRAQLLPLVVLEIVAAQVLAQRFLDAGQVFVARQVAAAGRDDAAASGDLPVAGAVIQGWQQLAQREVACPTENHEIELVDRYE